jgi:hypothetical protein
MVLRYGELIKERKRTMTQNLINAIEKSKRIKMSVRYLGQRAYLVITPANHQYTVRFEMINGLRYGRCNCKAGAKNVPCYHLPKAGLVDSAIQQMSGH